MWLVASERLKQPQPPALRKQLLEYLIEAQLCESRGFESNQAAYGGWDLMGAADAQGITTGSNISVLAHVVEAIAASDHPRAVKSLKRAADWLYRCQDACRDGGFAFTAEPMSLNNKAEFRDAKQNQPRSYGSATADGLRALLACGLDPGDDRVQQAAQWLAKRPGLEVVPGFDDLPLELGWQRGLRYYYLAALSRVLPALPAAEKAKRGSQIAKALLDEQKSNGNWQSDAPRMREDDPLIATCLALSALGHLART
jgi:hypothetical protein